MPVSLGRRRRAVETDHDAGDRKRDEGESDTEGGWERSGALSLALQDEVLGTAALTAKVILASRPIAGWQPLDLERNVIAYGTMKA